MEVNRVLVTGGAGFIGSALVRRLCEIGADVLVVDNLTNGRRERLDGLSPDQVRLVEADVLDGARMRELMRGVDVVYHLACLCLRHSLHAPELNHDVNATGTLRVLLAAREAGVKRFVYTSSAEVYGRAATMPLAETETLAPTNVYGAAKLAGEAYARALHITSGFPSVVLRLFNTYGPHGHHERDCGEVVPRFLLRCMAGLPMVVFGDGAQTRDFNYVDDIARGVCDAGRVDAAVGKTFNLGSGRQQSVAGLAALVAEVVGRPHAEVLYDEERPADIPTLQADASLARQILGFESKVSLREGLTRLKTWYQDRGVAPEVLLNNEVVHNWEGEVSGAA